MLPPALRRAAVSTCVAGIAMLPTALRAQAPVVTEQPFGVNTLVQAMHAVSDRVVWAAANNGVVLRTIDGGSTWTRLPAPGGDSLQYRDVHAASDTEAWILSIGNGSASRIYHTTDAGATWTPQFINRDTTVFLDCLSVGARGQAVVFGDASGTADQRRTSILRTEDGGATWRMLPPAAVPAPLQDEGAFAASGQCVMHGDANTVYIATGAPGARLFVSRNAGRTWAVENTPFVRGTAAGLTGLAFQSAQRGIAVGADINRLRNDTSSSVVGVTTDGGRTWEMRKRPPVAGALAGIVWVPGASAETAVVSGYGGAAYTHDAGRTWTAINTAASAGVTSAGKVAWLGGRGVIYRVAFP
ncbi:MAG: oxidoreductase [Gemmatimonadetes bacterium]|nr:oxidoreductase [Gemmatimonadota bacterium]